MDGRSTRIAAAAALAVLLASVWGAAGALGAEAKPAAPAAAPKPAAPAAKPAGPPAKEQAAPLRPVEPAAPQAPPLPTALEKARKIAAINRELFKRFQEQNYDECKKLLDQVLAIAPDNAVAFYNLACVYARTGKADEAVQALTTSIEKGYAGLRHMERDPDLDSIRGLEGYKAILARKDAIQRERADKVSRALKARFGEGYLYDVDHENKLIFATNVDERMLQDLRRHVTAYGEAQRRDLFTHGFEQYVTVVVPKAEGPSPVGGYYSHGDHLLVARTVGMTLVHEFTHALHAADQEGIGQQHPIWVTEGLATLFESSSVEGGHAVPGPNRRANTIQDIVRRKKHVPWAKFFKYSHAEFMRGALVAYPEARYIMMYFYEQGLLKTWYDAYVETFEEDASGAKAVEKAFAKPLARVEADWVAWVKSLERLPTRIAANHAYLGVAVVPVTDGLRISSVVAGSGAEKAGLKAGDVVIQVGDQRVIEPEQLMGIVSGEEVGAEVRVHFRRDGKYEETVVVLGAKPALPKPPPAEPKPAEPPKAPKPAEPAKPAEDPKPAQAPARKAA